MEKINFQINTGNILILDNIHINYSIKILNKNLLTDNFDRDYQNLKDNNIKIVREPKTEAYGKVLVFKDIYGNLWDLIQPNN